MKVRDMSNEQLAVMLLTDRDDRSTFAVVLLKRMNYFVETVWTHHPYNSRSPFERCPYYKSVSWKVQSLDTTWCFSDAGNLAHFTHREWGKRRRQNGRYANFDQQAGGGEMDKRVDALIATLTVAAILFSPWVHDLVKYIFELRW